MTSNSRLSLASKQFFIVGQSVALKDAIREMRRKDAG
jgi:hypothetical protein